MKGLELYYLFDIGLVNVYITCIAQLFDEDCMSIEIDGKKVLLKSY